MTTSPASVTMSHCSNSYFCRNNSSCCTIKACFSGRQPKTATSASLATFAVWLVEAASKKRKQLFPDSTALPTVFDSHTAAISIFDYVMRLKNFMRCSDGCFIIAGVYLHRYFCRTSGMCVTYTTIHRLILVCVVVAAKYIDDLFYSNSHYAAIGCVSLCNFNLMERQLLSDLDYKTHIKEEEFYIQTRYQMEALTNPELTSKAQIIPIELRPKKRNSVEQLYAFSPTNQSGFVGYSKSSSTSTTETDTYLAADNSTAANDSSTIPTSLCQQQQPGSVSTTASSPAQPLVNNSSRNKILSESCFTNTKQQPQNSSCISTTHSALSTVSNASMSFCTTSASSSCVSKQSIQPFPSKAAQSAISV